MRSRCVRRLHLGHLTYIPAALVQVLLYYPQRRSMCMKTVARVIQYGVLAGFLGLTSGCVIAPDGDHDRGAREHDRGDHDERRCDDHDEHCRDRFR